EGRTDLLNGMAAELLALRPDAFWCNSVNAAQAVKRLSLTVPIVFAVGVDPVAVGLVDSFSHPGGNITGIASNVEGLPGLRLQMLVKMTPVATRMGFFRTPLNNSTGGRVYVSQEEAGAKLGVPFVRVDLTSPKEIPAAFQAMVREHVDAVLIRGEGIFFV